MHPEQWAEVAHGHRQDGPAVGAPSYNMVPIEFTSLQGRVKDHGGNQRLLGSPKGQEKSQSLNERFVFRKSNKKTQISTRGSIRKQENIARVCCEARKSCKVPLSDLRWICKSFSCFLKEFLKIFQHFF